VARRRRGRLARSARPLFQPFASSLRSIPASRSSSLASKAWVSFRSSSEAASCIAFTIRSMIRLITAKVVIRMKGTKTAQAQG
jgi:hypothetical protein